MTHPADPASADDLRFLAEAGRTLMASLDYERTLESVLQLAVPRLADWCFADLLEPDGRSFRRLAVAFAAEERQELAGRLQRCCPPLEEAPHGVARAVRTMRAEWYHEPPETLIPALAGVDDDRTVMRELDIRSYMCVPLVARGRAIGALTCILAESGRHYGEADLALAGELAARAALAVDNARLHREAEQALRARDEVLAVVSHDLKNPLATITMSAAFMLETVPDDPAHAAERKQFEVIRRSADRAHALIRDLLDAARAEDGRLPVDPRPAAPAALVRETVELLAPQATGKGVRLEPAVSDDLPPVCADHDRTLQVLTNLVGNAVKFTPAGGRVRVSAEVRPHDGPDADGDASAGGEPATPVMRFTVCDTGPGLSADERQHLFHRYWQARRTASLGTGLGLVIAKGIVEAHGGRIWAESDGPGAGSSFYFTLPVDVQ